MKKQQQDEKRKRDYEQGKEEERQKTISRLLLSLFASEPRVGTGEEKRGEK